MNAPRGGILIAGHGLAGALLAWECERAGLDFTVADPGRGDGASLAAAGILNPITGRRLVPAWRVAELLPAARAVYREIEAALGAPVWRDLRVRRLFADERERATFAAKRARGELAPWAGAADAAGFWIEGAARVDVRGLLAGLRVRWQQAGRWRDAAVDPVSELARHDVVVDCTGFSAARSKLWSGLPWEFSKGEMLELAVAGIDPSVIVNRRQWLLPVAPGIAWVGATHQPGATDSAPTPTARDALEASARDLVGEGAAFSVTGQRAGVRVTLPDRMPIVGKHPTEPRLGVINALGAKGALWAPGLAREWVRHLKTGAAFTPEIAATRFGSSRHSVVRR